MRPLLVAACIAAALAAGGQTADAQPPAGTPVSPQRPGATDPTRAVDDAPRPVGRVSETAPTPRADAGRGSDRFRDDLARCDRLDGAARASCRAEMFAARAQGLYRN